MKENRAYKKIAEMLAKQDKKNYRGDFK